MKNGKKRQTCIRKLQLWFGSPPEGGNGLSTAASANPVTVSAARAFEKEHVKKLRAPKCVISSHCVVQNQSFEEAGDTES